MESLPNPPGHTGSSFSFTLRHLQYIAKHGTDEYKKKVTPIIENIENVQSLENTE
jgi:hypothetical protein